jgi:hypothetical protein
MKHSLANLFTTTQLLATIIIGIGIDFYFYFYFYYTLVSRLIVNIVSY